MAGGAEKVEGVFRLVGVVLGDDQRPGRDKGGALEVENQGVGRRMRLTDGGGNPGARKRRRRGAEMRLEGKVGGRGKRVGRKGR